MKRLLLLVIAATIMFAITSCSNNNNDSKSDDTIDETQIEEPWTRDGDYIIFGHYEQDGNLTNGPEPIEWEIVDEEDNRLLLISRYILDCQPYNTEKTGVTWENCSLRAWLNNEFYNSAFDSTEQNAILTATNPNADNISRGIDGGNDTEDNVFVLSVDEILDNYEFEEWDDTSYYGYSQALMAEVTQYAANQGAIINEDGFGDWWLRSPGNVPECAATVINSSKVVTDGFLVNSSIAVRPSIYLIVE